MTVHIILLVVFQYTNPKFTVQFKGLDDYLS